ncbi:MAG TPA: hypothetical protein VD793_06800 [Gemmatimonadales bacterium]|nr:hypothetical protein [Gemmatimonadales bacterium]
MALSAACQDLQFPGGEVVDGADLIMLPLQSGTPAPPAATFYVVNSRMVSRALRHPDNVLTLFADVEFPPGSLAMLNGIPVGPDDSVLVTVTPEAGLYGVAVHPADLEFSATARPRLTLSYARYGDLSAGPASGRYPDAASYAAALDLWRETGLDRWTPAVQSAATGSDAVTARLVRGGSLVAAAPR